MEWQTGGILLGAKPRSHPCYGLLYKPLKNTIQESCFRGKSSGLPHYAMFCTPYLLLLHQGSLVTKTGLVQWGILAKPSCQRRELALGHSAGALAADGHIQASCRVCAVYTHFLNFKLFSVQAKSHLGH